MKTPNMNKLIPSSHLFLAYIFIVTALVFLTSVVFIFFGDDFLSVRFTTKEIILTAISIWLALIMFCPFFILGWKKVSPLLAKPFLRNQDPLPSLAKDQNSSFASDIILQYGRQTSRTFRYLLITGTPAAVEKLAPGLTREHWQEADGTLLIWGGDVLSVTDEPLIRTLKQLRRRRPLDAIIWVTENGVSETLSESSLTACSINAAEADSACRSFHQLYKALRWQAPVWLWSLTPGENLSAPDTPAVLCMPQQGVTPEILTTDLRRLLPAVTTQGVQSVLAKQTDTWLLMLARFLRADGSRQLSAALTPFFSGIRALPFAGIAFSTVPVAQTRSVPNTWYPDSRWHSLLNAQKALSPSLKPQATGISRKRILQYSAATVMVVWGAGMVMSYLMNRQMIEDTRQQVSLAADTRQSDAERLKAQFALQQTLGLLSHRAAASVPVWLRFGLSSNSALQVRLWPVYSKTILPLLRNAAGGHLEAQLQALAQLPPDSPERTAAAAPAYQALKAYLMMSQPERMDPAFFAETVLHVWPQHEGMTDGQWMALGNELLTFYAKQLPAHPEWVIKRNKTLVSRTRTLLIREMGQRNGESALYDSILQQAKDNFADMTLDEMAGETDASFLFSTDEVVPGIFTRKAWEDSVEPAINQAVNGRREEIDWVLSDNQQTMDSNIDPEQLKQRLTERYFADFSGAWLNFLNSLQWRGTENLSDTIDQLTLMSDIRQSPVIALMNTVAYQGKTGRQQEKLSDSFMNSAKDLLNKESQPLISQNMGFTGPLEPVFGPVLAFVDPQPAAQGSDAMNLQTYLTRITRVRLKLQQVVNAPDPQAMSQALAQSVFEGKTVDLSETRDYGSLAAAGLGQEWSGFGESLLVQPMSQAWQQLLTPTAQGINSQWQNAVVNDWNAAFGGRYPLKNTRSDIALPLLAQYLRADSGRIQRFLETRLKGVLHKEGTHWVPDSTNAQGLTFNPEFLKALDTLSYISDVVFAEGEARLYFEMRPGTSDSVMQTVLTIDKQPLVYDNQVPDWQRFVWPADTVASGASLSWMSTKTGTRLYGDHRGVWGFIRLLENANVSPYAGNTSSYRIVWKTQNGQSLNYVLRTEMGDGPLALLKLRNFVLPDKIFLDE
ncbi:ImcF-related family protein [Morganella psychrotolerans]